MLNAGYRRLTLVLASCAALAAGAGSDRPPFLLQNYVEVLQVARPGTKLPHIQRLDSGAQVGSWEVRLKGRRALIESAGPQ